jgi:hypothetical protein
MVEGGEVLFRSTNRENGAGYFSCDGGGRFDLSPPNGTLYAARSVHTAALERIRSPLEVPIGDGRIRRIEGPYIDGGIEEEDAEQVLIWELTAERRLEVANLTAQGAAAFGVTLELSGGGGPNAYNVAQKWAAKFHSEQFDGVEYSSRLASSTSRDDNAVAVFGQAGAGPGPFRIADAAKTLVELAGIARVNIRAARRSPPPVSGSL